jgi:hypothetical protein
MQSGSSGMSVDHYRRYRQRRPSSMSKSCCAKAPQIHRAPTQAHGTGNRTKPRLTRTLPRRYLDEAWWARSVDVAEGTL